MVLYPRLVKFLLYILCLFTLFDLGCSNGRFECVNSDSPKIKEVRNLSGFHSVVIFDNFDVEIITDSVNSAFARTLNDEFWVEFSTNDYLIPNLEASVKDSVLTIHNNNTCGWLRNPDERIQLKIRVGQLKKLEIFDLVKITNCQPIKGNLFNFNHSSKEDGVLNVNVTHLNSGHNDAGDCEYSGYAGIFVLTLFDFGTANARKMQGDYVYVYHYSLRDCYIKPVKELIVYTYNEGSTYYYQEPWKIAQQKLGGTGKLIKS